MADSSPASSDIPENETPTQKQARLRRERRAAKLAAGGTDRLQKIMNVSGREQPPVADAPTQKDGARSPGSNTSQSAKPTFGARQQDAMSYPDPDIADISSISDPFSTPGNNASADPMMRMMQQMLAQHAGGEGAQQGQPGSANPQDDPMMKMVQQMMAGGIPGMPGMEGAQEQQPAPPSTAYIWRIIHAVFALTLALYVGVTTRFTGSQIARAESTLVDDSLKGGMATRLFLLFATAELVLQSSRYFLEKGSLPSSGILGTLTQFLPEPWAGYIRTAGRYSIIYTTVMADAMVIVFVLGVLAWWNGSGT